MPMPLHYILGRVGLAGDRHPAYLVEVRANAGDVPTVILTGDQDRALAFASEAALDYYLARLDAAGRAALDAHGLVRIGRPG